MPCTRRPAPQPRTRQHTAGRRQREQTGEATPPLVPCRPSLRVLLAPSYHLCVSRAVTRASGTQQHRARTWRALRWRSGCAHEPRCAAAAAVAPTNHAAVHALRTCAAVSRCGPLHPGLHAAGTPRPRQATEYIRIVIYYHIVTRAAVLRRRGQSISLRIS